MNWDVPENHAVRVLQQDAATMRAIQWQNETRGASDEIVRYFSGCAKVSEDAAGRLLDIADDEVLFRNVWQALDDLATALREDMDSMDLKARGVLSDSTIFALQRAEDIGAGMPDVEEESRS